MLHGAALNRAIRVNAFKTDYLNQRLAALRSRAKAAVSAEPASAEAAEAGAAGFSGERDRPRSKKRKQRKGSADEFVCPPLDEVVTLLNGTVAERGGTLDDLDTALLNCAVRRAEEDTRRATERVDAANERQSGSLLELESTLADQDEELEREMTEAVRRQNWEWRAGTLVLGSGGGADPMQREMALCRKRVPACAGGCAALVDPARETLGLFDGAALAQALFWKSAALRSQELFRARLALLNRAMLQQDVAQVNRAWTTAIENLSSVRRRLQAAQDRAVRAAARFSCPDADELDEADRAEQDSSATMRDGETLRVVFAEMIPLTQRLQYEQSATLYAYIIRLLSKRNSVQTAVEEWQRDTSEIDAHWSELSERVREVAERLSASAGWTAAGPGADQRVSLLTAISVLPADAVSQARRAAQQTVENAAELRLRALS